MSTQDGVSRFDPHELAAERVRHLYRHRDAGLWTNAAGGVFMVLILWPTFRLWTLAWFALFLGAHGSQWMMGRRRKGGTGLLVPVSSLGPHRLAAALAGGAWGLAGLSLPWLDAHQVPSVLVLVVVACVISLPRMAAMPDIYLGFAASAMTPLALSAIWLPFDQARMVWMVVGLVSAVLWLSARAVEADLMDVVTKRLDLERMAWEDKLTGLANRRRFDAVLAAEWRRAARMKVPLSLILLDVDHFKRFNDTYGHTPGDACLTMVGGVLASTVRRAGDFAARYGGEEFVMLLFHTSRADATLLAERVRQAVRALGVPHSGSPEGVVTVSMGGATVMPRVDGSPQALLDQADEALYQATEQGRDKVVWGDVQL